MGVKFYVCKTAAVQLLENFQFVRFLVTITAKKCKKNLTV